MMLWIFGMQIKIEVFYKLILSFWVCRARHFQFIQNKAFPYLCNISRRTWWAKLIFCLQINTKAFYKFIVSLWVCVNKHAQSTQSTSFVMQNIQIFYGVPVMFVASCLIAVFLFRILSLGFLLPFRFLPFLPLALCRYC